MNRQQLSDYMITAVFDMRERSDGIKAELAALNGVPVPTEEALQRLLNLSAANVGLINDVLGMVVTLSQYIGET